MKHIIILLFLSVNFSCISTKDNLVVLQYYSNDTLNINNKTEVFSSTLNIGYLNDLTVYEIPIANFGEFKLDSASGSYNASDKAIDTTYLYYVSKKDDSKGILYNAVASKAVMTYSKDSLIRALNFDEESLRIFSVKLPKPVETLKNKLGKIEVEKFDSKILETDADTIYRYFNDKLKKVDFTFSKNLDKEKDSKLSKTTFIYLKDNKPNSQPRIISHTGIRKIEARNPKELTQLFGRFTEDSKLFNLNE